MKRTRTERIRLSVIFAFVCLFFAIAVARLIHLQVFLHPAYARQVIDQSSVTIDIPARRGLIYDRRGRVVANNVTRPSLYAYPVNQRELEEVSRYLEKLYRLKRGTARQEYGLKVNTFRWIDRMMSDEWAAQIEKTAPTGLKLREETERSYPYGSIGKQVLGFTNIDNMGQSALEMTLDSVLAGKPGKADIQVDGRRRYYRVKEQALVPPIEGQSVVLTVDWALQEIFEEELRTGVEEYHAKWGMGAFVDCRTGEILAMAHYDPNEANPDKPFRLRAVTDQFEPGSIFKAFTAAAILDNEVIGFDDSVYCEEGKWKTDSHTLHDDHEYGWLDLRHIIEYSSNIGVAKCANELGGEELFQTAKRFGFGEKVGLGLGGEISGSIAHPNKWSEYMIGALAMGHGIAVNALQMANGFASVANGGELLEPHLVLCCVDQDQNVTRRAERVVRRRVLKKNSADSLAAFLRGVVEEGTATKVNSRAVAIAGKTGTAEVVDVKAGRILKNKFVASFAGFFPYEDPIVAGVVVLYEPEPIHYGGYTSGPIFRRVAERYMILNPDMFTVSHQLLAERSHKVKGTVEVPNFVGADLARSAALAEETRVRVRANRDEGQVIWQYPPADRLLFEGDEVVLGVQSPVETGTPMVDLRGLSIREASAFLKFAGINSRIKGRGKVYKQSIKPGEIVSNDAVCWLECRPI